MAKVMVFLPRRPGRRGAGRHTFRSALLQGAARRQLGLLRRERGALLDELDELSRMWEGSVDAAALVRGERLHDEQVQGAAAAWIVDASVASKWFLPVDREPDDARARAAISALSMRTTALAVHEVGNILIRSSGWTADRIIAALGLLVEICGEPLELVAADHRATVELALAHDLTFYDASYVSIARRTRRSLLSADQDLLTPGFAVAPSTAFGPPGT